MKKLFAGVLAAALLVGVTACNTGAKSAKTGFAVVGGNTPSHQKAPEGEDAGVVEFTAIAAAALVGEDGKVIKFETDQVQTKIEYDAEGNVSTADATKFPSKAELGDEYNMKGASAANGIGKEWHEQNEAFEEFVIGKTAAEIRAIATEEGRATDTELASGVTITITPMIEAAAQAVENATDLGAKATDKLGMYIDSEASVDGTEIMAYNHYAVVTLDGDKITSSYIDASQDKANVEGGALNGELSTELRSKMVLKEEYNMKGASEAREGGIGKEWYEQSMGFSEWAKGKTVADVTGTGLEEGRPTDTELASSVTVHVNTWLSALDAAAKSAE